MTSLAADEEALARHARMLADGVRAALGPWVIRSVRQVAATQDLALDPTAPALTAAAEACRSEIGDRVTELLGRDIDRQPHGPLQVIRGAARYPTEVLDQLGARPVARDRFAVETFPDDIYDLAPASFADLDPELVEPGIVWGAAKAHVHLRRRREGRQ